MSHLTRTDQLIRELIEREPTLNLVLDEYPDVTIVPVILTDDCTAEPELIGKLEYQCSDDVPGKRGNSIDVYSWNEIREACSALQQKEVINVYLAT